MLKMDGRAIWSAVLTSSTVAQPHCSPFTLPSNGIVIVNPTNTITLNTDAVFQPECTGLNSIIVANSNSPSTLFDLRDKFYASTLPQLYALAAMTVIAYMLVIMLLITPRTFLHEGAVVLGRRGFTNGPSGSDAGIGIGGRPWLQKVAALTVVISLTIATADTFKIAESQYNRGYMDGAALVAAVADGTELKVIRIISDTFLWLAQAQTLIRLFPRQREKVIIKWTAFALITLDALFSTLNNFVYDNESRPHSFVDAIPALSYLFQLALSLLYCAWVMYYSITKKRFAFYHAQMRNICLVALLSFISVLVPVVFFVLDISNPKLAAWGDYVRWVGAAAASVAVWEWVERIEALERNDKKDGVLGREVFDGDEMLDITPESESRWISNSNNGKDDDNNGSGATTGKHGKSWPTIARRYRPWATPDVEASGKDATKTSQPRKQDTVVQPPLWPARPPQAATPVSRTDTASAESTVYAVRYHPINEATPSARENVVPSGISQLASADAISSPAINSDSDGSHQDKVIGKRKEERDVSTAEPHHNAWPALTKVIPFKKGVQAPPPEVSAHTVRQEAPTNSHGSSNRWDVRAKFEDFAATQADKLREKIHPPSNVAPLQVTVIPAPTRRRNLAETLEDLERGERSQPQRSDSAQREPLSSNRSQPTTQLHRLSDPYTPEDLRSHSITQRGAISFLTQSRLAEGREMDEHGNSPLSSTRNSSGIIRTTASTRTSNGLHILSIPPPPRHSWPEED